MSTNRYSVHETPNGWQVFKNFGNGGQVGKVFRLRADAEAKAADLDAADMRRFAISDARARSKNQCECTGECGRDSHPGRCPNIGDDLCAELGSNPIRLKVVAVNHDIADLRPENLRAYCQLCRQRHDEEEFGAAAMFDIATGA